MKKSLLILVLTVLVACSSTETAPDKFTIIAEEEWQGGNINEMIAVWGNPKVLKQASADGEDLKQHYGWSK